MNYSPDLSILITYIVNFLVLFIWITLPLVVFFEPIRSMKPAARLLWALMMLLMPIVGIFALLFLEDKKETG
jgi:hypothetical protein